MQACWNISQWFPAWILHMGQWNIKQTKQMSASFLEYMVLLDIRVPPPPPTTFSPLLPPPHPAIPPPPPLSKFASKVKNSTDTALLNIRQKPGVVSDTLSWFSGYNMRESLVKLQLEDLSLIHAYACWSLAHSALPCDCRKMTRHQSWSLHWKTTILRLSLADSLWKGQFGSCYVVHEG